MKKDPLRDYIAKQAIDAVNKLVAKKDDETSTNNQTNNTSNKGTSSSKTSSSEKINQRYENTLASASSGQLDVQKKIDSFLGDLTGKYDAFLDKLTEASYKDTDYYGSIVSEYEELGKRMAYDASASAAASNGGNFDTLGAANAHRQMLSYKKAGEQAARDAYSEEIDRYAKGLLNYASDISDAYKLLSDSAGKADDYNISMLDALEGYRRLQDEKEATKQETIIKELREKLDKDNKSSRYFTYAQMLATVYPEYREEIQKLFLSK